ncbi:metabotropic glutamate receptor 1-like protein [Leptotrombidium deliense]|uniref:Metabotropic glutamate receptor 1-like protein n=1 Tax=Leptotrombidium deliense TaxID=299467 RepID=A0A443SE97_9ACAR|nr:metabotropic glutamate receptor 1-like protein [Leptotrombidium deliense]
MANPVKGFDDYFLSLTPESNKRNPWFIEYWEHYFKCKWPKSQSTPYNEYRRECIGNEKMSYSNGYEAEKQLQFVSDAVLAFGYAFKKMHQDLCPNVKGLCSQMVPIDGTLLLKYLQNINFTGLSGDYFQFTRLGDGPVRYNLIHFKQTEENTFQWVNVGTYEEEKLNLDLNKVQFRLNKPEVPTSVCSLPCGKGQAKKYIEGENCCWHCFDCTKYQFLITETRCAECPDGYLPDEEKLIITLLWFAFSPPKAINYYPNREDNQLVCAAYISPTYFIAFCYPIILIVICTVYAVLTRKIPEAFNESKYIGFTMYTTCVIWLAFVPIYFTTKTNISLNLMTMSIATNLSAFITLICLFTPKLYIILLHPEKNVRQSMMSHKQPVSKNNFSTIGTSSSKVDNIDAQSNGEFQF